MSKIESAGRYPATVTAAEFGESQAGTPFLALDITTTTGELITAWLYLSEKALANTLKTLRDAFGFDGNFETAVDQVVGKAYSITVESEEYQGKDTLKVKWINAPRAEIADKDSFLKRLTQTAARIPARATPASAPTRTAPPAARPAPATNRAVGQATPPPTAQNKAPDPF